MANLIGKRLPQKISPSWPRTRVRVGVSLCGRCTSSTPESTKNNLIRNGVLAREAEAAPFLPLAAHSAINKEENPRGAPSGPCRRHQGAPRVRSTWQRSTWQRCGEEPHATVAGPRPSLRALAFRAAVRRGWKEGSPAGALDPARGLQQPPLQHSCGPGAEQSRAGGQGSHGGRRAGATQGGVGATGGNSSPATVSWLSAVGPQ